MASVPDPSFCVSTDVGAKGPGTQNVGPKKLFPPKNSIAYGKYTSQRIYPKQHTSKIG